MDTSLADQMTDRSLSGRILVERYRLGERIGRGELGDVYAADDMLRRSIGDNAGVAVKVFHKSLVHTCGGLRGMAPYLASACRLSHPNVVNAFDFYQDGEMLLLAMEQLSGVTMADCLTAGNDQPPMTAEEADAALRKIVDALVYMHATTTPLLRLNPHRIRLMGEDRQLCVADLGLSSLIDPTLLCHSAMTAGTAAYLAPEVVAGSGSVDCRADQFSLGALALALFTGSPRGSTAGLHRAVARSAAATWMELLPRLLEESPNDRFDDLVEVQAILMSAGYGKLRRKGRTRLDGTGTPEGTVSRRTWWPIERPWVAATTGAIGLSIAYAAWTVGPDFLFRGKLEINVTTQIDEARRQLHEMDGLRMALLTKGLSRAPFDANVRALAAAKPDYDLVDGLGTASVALANNQNDSAQLLLSSVGVSLSERIDQFRDAAMAIDACDQLLRLRATAGELTALADLPEAATADRIDEVWRQATKTFGDGDFRTSAATATKAASGAEQALTDALRSRRAEAHAAHEAWMKALRQVGDFPEIEPIGEPAKQIALGETADASGDRVEAARRFTAARNRYRLWADELMDSVPNVNQSNVDDSDGQRATEGPPMIQEAFTNSLGMRFVAVDDLMASIWETRLIDYLAFTYETGVDAGYLWRDFAATGTSWRGSDDDGSEDVAATWGDLSVTPIQGPCHPVTLVGTVDARRFCEWLTQRERESKLISDDQYYRLPSDLEWSRLVGLKDDPDKTPLERSFDHLSYFPWGDEPVRRATSGNYATWPNREDRGDLRAEQDRFVFTSPVGSFAPNAFGIFDLGGNVWERTSGSLYGSLRLHSEHVIRGGGWRSFHLDTLRSACRDSSRNVNEEVGFRVVLARDQSDIDEAAREPAGDRNDGN
ncbi:MAG: SUMF1/EgtB/PvdO family nonheme iron enzyme [Verrucomicrobiales bacterium]